MAGFAKNITTPIDIPTVQAPNFNANTSNVQDLATLASFGLAINDRIEAKDKEANRKAIELDANKFVDGLVTTTLENAQQGGGLSKALIGAQKAISARGTPLQSAFISSEFSKRIASVQQGGNSGSEGKPSDAFSVAAKDTQSVALAALGLSDVPSFGTQDRDALNMQVNKQVTVETVYDTNKKIVEHTDNVTAAQLSDLSVSSQKVMSGQFTPLINQMTKILEESKLAPNAERAAILDGLNGNVATLKGVALDFVDTTFAGVDPAKAKVQKEQLLGQIDRVFKSFENASEEELGKAAKLHKFLIDNLNLDLFASGDIIEGVKARFGRNIPELTWEFITDNAKSPFVTSLEGAVEKSIGLFTPEQKSAVSLQSLHEYVNGGGSIDDVANELITPEEKKGMYEQGFKFLQSHTRNGKLIQLPGEDINRIGDAMINVLQDASVTDENTSDRIISWAKDPNFQSVLGKIDQDKASAIRNMIVTKAKHTARSGSGSINFINSNPNLFKFDIASGKFSLTSEGDRLPRQVGSGLLAGSGVIPKRKAVDAVRRANRDTVTFLENAKANAGLSELSTAGQLDWFLNKGQGVPLTEEVQFTGGAFPIVTPANEEAIDANRTTKDLEAQKQAISDRASLPSQVLELQDQIRKLRDAGVQKPTADFQDLTDEEFKQLIKDEEARRANK